LAPFNSLATGIGILMSWWIQTKDKSGKRSVYSIDVNPLVFMLALALCVSFFAPSLLGNPRAGVTSLLVLIAVGSVLS
jgi:hypothetical protein